jgi:molecular chaperone HtpG
LTEYEGFPLKNVDDAGLDLPGRATDAAEAAPQADFEALLAFAKSRLGERVTDVRASDLLVDSPARLVSPEDARGRDMDRVRRLIEKDYSIPKKIMELNRRHPLVKNLSGLAAGGRAEALVGDCLEQLYENSLLLEGLHPNPAEMVGRIQALMEAATQSPG